MKKISALIVLAGMSALVFYYFWSAYTTQEEGIPLTVSDTNSTLPCPEGWEMKTDDQASVTVSVTPDGIDLSPQATEWRFDIVMSTHSVELGEDLTQTAVLVDDQGKEYTPLRWGAHRKGAITGRVH